MKTTTKIECQDDEQVQEDLEDPRLDLLVASVADVVAEQILSAILSYAAPSTRTWTNLSKTTRSGSRGR